MERQLNVATLPGGAWGSAFSIVAAESNHNVKLLLREPKDYKSFLRSHKYSRRLPGIRFPDNVTAVDNVKDALLEADVVVLAPPSRFLREYYLELRDTIPQQAVIILLTKGLELGSNKVPTQVLEEIDPKISQRLAVLSGPNLASEVAKGLPCAAVLASANYPLAESLQRDFSTPSFRIYAQDDVLSVQLGGAIKNVIAFAAGIGDGLGKGENGRAVLIVRGLTESMRFVKHMGGTPETLVGLSGLGDMIATGTSKLSRNHEAGRDLAKGKVTVEELFSNPKKTVEALYTVKAVMNLAREGEFKMPISEAVFSVLYEGVSIEEAYASLIERPLSRENGFR